MKDVTKSLFIVILTLFLFTGIPCYADETQVITDITGNKVVLPANITRAVNIDPFSAQFLYVIGAENKLIATQLGPSNKEVVKKVQPSLASLPSAGHKDNINKEELMRLNPEVVISSVDYINDNEVLKQLGIPFVILDFETPDNLIKSYRIIGQMFGKEKETEEFISYYNEKMTQIRKDLAVVTNERKIPVYFAQRKPDQTLGDDYYEAAIADIAGADNVAKGISGGSNIVTMDQIYSWNPEAVILLPYCSANVSTILSDPAWQALPAVQEKQVYRMPKYLMTWEMPVPESVLATMWIENTLYPNYVSYDLKDEIKSFYKKFYRLDMSDEDVQRMLDDKEPVIITENS